MSNVVKLSSLAEICNIRSSNMIPIARVIDVKSFMKMSLDPVFRKIVERLAKQYLSPGVEEIADQCLQTNEFSRNYL